MKLTLSIIFSFAILLTASAQFSVPLLLVNNAGLNAVPVGNTWISSYTFSETRSDNYCAGVEFTVGATNITVTALGRYNANSSNAGNHTIGIYQTSGNVLKYSTNINCSGAAVGWQYTTIAPTTLTAGTSYTLCSLEGTGAGGDDVWEDIATATTLITGAATIVQGRYISSTTFQFPTGTFGSQPYAGVNFQFQ